MGRCAVLRRVVTSLAIVTSLAGAAAFAQPLAKPVFTDINPDESGSIRNYGCLSPCISGGTGGRVHHMDTSDSKRNEIYAASELGGLFKSTDTGETWKHLDGFLPTKAWDVAVDPAGDIVYATSFYDGRIPTQAGIGVSTDGGGTWSRPATAAPPAGMCAALRQDAPSGFGIAIRSGAANEVLVGTNCGLAHSEDSGATWNYVDPASTKGNARSVWDVVALPGGLTYACGQDGVMSSPDGRTGWTMLTTPSDGTGNYTGYCSIAADGAAPTYVFVVFSRITFFDPIVDIRQTAYFASFDSGTTWTKMPHPDGAGPKRVPMVVTNRRIYPPLISGFDVWVGAGQLARIPCKLPSALFKFAGDCPVTDTAKWATPFTDAQGDNTLVHGDTGSLLFDPAPNVDACPVLYASDGGIYKNKLASSPECHSPAFREVNTGLHAQLLLGMAGVNRPGVDEEHLYFGTQDVGLFSTLNAGRSPKPTWRHGVGGDLFDVQADNTQSVTVPGPLRAAVNYVSPVTVNIPEPLIVPGFTVFTDVIDQWTTGSYVAITAGKSGVQVRYTTNLTTASVAAGTVSWKALPAWPSARTPCAVQAARDGLRKGAAVRFYVLATGGNCLWREQNELWMITLAGVAWERIDDNAPALCNGANGSFGFFSVDAVRGRNLYASCTVGASPVMLRSTDAGANWAVDQNLTELMSGFGKFAANTGDIGDGATFGAVQPVMVAFDPRDSNILVAGGYESGLFISSDGGNGWALLTDPYTPAISKRPHLPRPFYAHFDHPSGRALQGLYIGTVGRGVWRIKPAQTLIQITEVVARRCGVTPCAPNPCPYCVVSKGEKLDVTFRVKNNGRAFAGNPIFRYDIPDGLALRSLLPPSNWRCSPREERLVTADIVCTTQSLRPGQAAEFRLQVEVLAENGTTLKARGSIASDAIDPRPADNYVDTANVVNPAADVGVRQDVTAALVRGMQEVRFEIVTRNAGPLAATNVTLTDTIPSAAVSVTSDSRGCQVSVSTVKCDLGTIPAGEQRVTTIVASFPAGRIGRNVVNVLATEQDPHPANNKSTAAVPASQ